MRQGSNPNYSKSVFFVQQHFVAFSFEFQMVSDRRLLPDWRRWQFRWRRSCLFSSLVVMRVKDHRPREISSPITRRHLRSWPAEMDVRVQMRPLHFISHVMAVMAFHARWETNLHTLRYILLVVLCNGRCSHEFHNLWSYSAHSSFVPWFIRI